MQGLIPPCCAPLRIPEAVVLAHRVVSCCQRRQALPLAGEGQLGRRWPGLRNPNPQKGPGQQLSGSSEKEPTGYLFIQTAFPEYLLWACPSARNRD